MSVVAGSNPSTLLLHVGYATIAYATTHVAYATAHIGCGPKDDTPQSMYAAICRRGKGWFGCDGAIKVSWAYA